jgi:protein transport protein SEC9
LRCLLIIEGGYGQDRYGASGQESAPRRPGGYGGLGPGPARNNSNETMSTDAGRNELFGNAPSRYQQSQSQPTSGAYGQQSGAYGGDSTGADQGYGEHRAGIRAT